MSNEVIITARAELDDVIKALRQVQKAGVDVQQTMADTGKGVTEKLRDNTKQTQRFLEDLKDFTRRAAEEIKGAFEGLAKTAALKVGDRISHEMKNAVTDAQRLNDTLRKVGNTLGFTGEEFVKFQTEMTQGFAKLGLDASAAANAMEGLGETQVRGKDAMQDYAKAAGLLAGIGKERGSEASIVKGIAGVISERGGDVNDRGQQQQVINATLSAMLNTGKTATQALAEQKDFFSGLAGDKYRAFDPKAYAGMALAEQVSPGAMSFFKAYNNQSALGRLPAAAQGLGGAFNENGLNVDYLRKFLRGATGRISFSPEDAMRTFGVDEAGAKGAVRLMQNLDKLEAAQKRAAANHKTLGEAYNDSLGFGEAVQGGFNRVKGVAAGPLANATNTATDYAKKISSGDFSPLKEHAGLLTGLGFLGLAGGASSLTKIFGKGGAGTALGSSLAKGAAAEAITGQKTIPVYVVNAHEIGGGGGAGLPGVPGVPGSNSNLFGKVGTALGVVGLAITAAAVTIDAIEANTKDSEGKSWGTRQAAALDKWVKGATFGQVDLADSVHRMLEALGLVERALETNTGELKKSKSPTFTDHSPGRKAPKQVPLGSRGPGQ